MLLLNKSVASCIVARTNLRYARIMPTKQLPLLFVQAAIVATATILAIVLVTRYVSPLPISITQTTTQKESAFQATGKSVISTVPDKVEVVIGISRKETDIKLAQTRANEIINTINQKLGELGIPKSDIKTQNYTINPNYDYQKATQDIVGYSVDVSLLVSTTDFTKVNQVIDLATAAGANQVGSIQFTLSDEKEKQVREEARQKAIDDAKANAQELAKLAGMKLGRIVNVTEDEASPQLYLMEKADAVGRGGAAGSPTNVEPGSTQYSYSVTLSYETL